ncbi:fimbria/pilus outer membrane usher protein [Planctobacterium marinum]|uniref:Uncharacterized protein n=1 Tax=Planctobacterium marinum TaxID=1631968 RepID=A0AA48KNV8_9ALTE|nr:hypothetical protein MACH26_14770 [Planctobacterium marinum]
MSLPVQWQERKIGEVSFVLENFSLHSVEGDALALPLSGLLNDELLRFLNQSPSEILISTLAERGLSLTLNTKDLVVQLELAPEAMAVDQLTYGNRDYLAKPSDAAKWSILNDFNLRIDKSNIDEDRLALDWVAQSNYGGHDGYNLNWSVFYEKEDDDQEVYRGDITLFKDNFSKPRRFEIGDLSSFNKGHLPAVNAGGIGISTPYQQLQPLKRISPTNSQEFYMRLAGEVQVVVNGNIVAKVRLNPGRYDLNDLPLSTGQNDVEVIAIYVNGERESFTFNTFFNSQLLEEGLTIWAFNIGYPSQFRDFRYDYLDPLVMTGFYETGITNTLSAGVNALYVDGDFLVGTSATAGTAWGNFTLRMTTSEYQSTPGSSISIDTEHTVLGSSDFGVPNLRLSYQSRKDFVQSPWLENPTTGNDESWSVNYSWFITDKIDFNLNARRTRNSNDVTSENISAQLNWRYKSMRVSVQYQRQKNDSLVTDDEDSLFINFNWSAFDNQSLTRKRVDYRSQNNNLRASYAKINRNYQDDWGYSIEANKTDELEAVTLSSSYTHNRFRADMTARTQQREGLSRSNDYRLNLSSSVAIADGKIGIGSNVQTPFAIIDVHPTLKKAEVQINPSPTGQSLGSANTELAGLVNLGSGFTENIVNINALNVPLGYDWGPGTYNIVGGTNTGHVLTIGSDLSYTALGYVKDAENNPVSLQRGTITGEGISATLFTNRKGRFVVEGVGVGKYEIKFGEATATIEIKASEISLVRLGIVKLYKSATTGTQ